VTELGREMKGMSTAARGQACPSPPGSPRWSRRKLLKGVGALAGAALLDLEPARAEPPPETRRIRLMKASLCTAPAYIAEELLRNEGFSEVQYYDDDPAEIGTSKLIATGAADLNMSFGLTTLIRVDAGEPVVMLGGVHAGCYELFGTQHVRSIRDLRGRKVAVPGLGSSHHLFLSIIFSYVGLDPHRDISWVTLANGEAKHQLADGKIDAYLGFPPDPQELRSNGIGHVVLNSSTDQPWSQYFCCMVIGNRDFVRRNPVATKRALRALLKATDLCAQQPARAAQFLVDKGYVQSREYALQTLSDVPYRKWREYNPEDSVRFFALRLHDVGMVKSTPQKLIAQGTDWRFLNELKKELKT
jgi:NitT/TauT family transport system substrate-binding protein